MTIAHFAHLGRPRLGPADGVESNTSNRISVLVIKQCVQCVSRYDLSNSRCNFRGAGPTILPRSFAYSFHFPSSISRAALWRAHTKLSLSRLMMPSSLRAGKGDRGDWWQRSLHIRAHPYLFYPISKLAWALMLPLGAAMLLYQCCRLLPLGWKGRLMRGDCILTGGILCFGLGVQASRSELGCNIFLQKTIQNQ